MPTAQDFKSFKCSGIVQHGVSAILKKVQSNLAKGRIAIFHRSLCRHICQRQQGNDAECTHARYVKMAPTMCL